MGFPENWKNITRTSGSEVSDVRVFLLGQGPVLHCEVFR